MTEELTVRMTPKDSMKSKTITFTFGEKSSTRATLAELNITDLWLFDYMGDELKQTIHKTDGFDAAALSLDYGEHALCFVAFCLISLLVYGVAGDASLVLIVP